MTKLTKQLSHLLRLGIRSYTHVSLSSSIVCNQEVFLPTIVQHIELVFIDIILNPYIP